MSLEYICRTATTFDRNGKVDEEALARYLERFVEPRIGVYVASSGSGVGQALSFEELDRIYRVANEVCKGRIPLGANIPEQYTSAQSIEHARLAIDGGVDIVNIYGPDGRHGFRPTDSEYLTYFDRILAEISYPISLCPLPAIGYTPKPSVIAAICNRYAQVQNVILTGIFDDMYFINLRDALTRSVEIYPTVPGSFNTLAMGATGLAGNEANIVPKTIRHYLDLYSARELEEAAAIYADLRRFAQFTEQWPGGPPRWVVMFLKNFKLPGGEGALPDPFLNYGEVEQQRFVAGLLALNLPEIQELAAAAGLEANR